MHNDVETGNTSSNQDSDRTVVTCSFAPSALMRSLVVATAKCTSPGNWSIRLKLGEEIQFSGSGLRAIMRILQQFLSVDH